MSLAHKCLLTDFSTLETKLIAQKLLYLSMKVKFPSRLVYKAAINSWAFIMAPM